MQKTFSISYLRSMDDPVVKPRIVRSTGKNSAVKMSSTNVAKRMVVTSKHPMDGPVVKPRIARPTGKNSAMKMSATKSVKLGVVTSYHA